MQIQYYKREHKRKIESARKRFQPRNITIADVALQQNPNYKHLFHEDEDPRDMPLEERIKVCQKKNENFFELCFLFQEAQDFDRQVINKHKNVLKERRYSQFQYEIVKHGDGNGTKNQKGGSFYEEMGRINENWLENSDELVLANQAN